MPSKVSIIEDHELLAQSVAMALEDEGLEARVVVPRSVDDMLDEVADFAPDVVLLDLDLGGELKGLSLVERVRALGPKVLVVTGVTDRVRLAECLEAGASGVLSKAEPFERLLAAVLDTVAGAPTVSRDERTQYLVELERARAKDERRMAPFRRLTAREAAVLDALVEGKSAEAIAAESFVSITTVRSQIRSLLQKLGVGSQLEAVALVKKAGWTSKN